MELSRNTTVMFRVDETLYTNAQNKKRQGRNNVVNSTTFPGLEAEYCPRDIFTTDVTQLELCRSPVAGEITKETLKEIQPINADAIMKMQPTVVEGSEWDYLGHTQQYLGCSVYDLVWT